MKPSDILAPDSRVYDSGFDRGGGKGFYPAISMVLVSGNTIALGPGDLYRCVKTGDYETAELVKVTDP